MTGNNERRTASLNLAIYGSYSTLLYIIYYIFYYTIYFIIQCIQHENPYCLIQKTSKTIQGNCFYSVLFVALFTRYFSYFNISVKVSAYC